MSKKYIICLFVIIILICFSIMLYTKKEKNIQIVTSTYDERILWNTILNNNKYLSKIDVLFKDVDITELVKIALVSDEVPTEYISKEDIKANYLLTKGDGYKKSIEEISKYLEKNFNKTSLEYNFVETYVEDGQYLITDENYVYFTKINIPEKVYIAVEYNVDGNEYVAEIYEYDIAEDNKTILDNMLETGSIDKNIEIANKYKIKGKIEDGQIKILYKFKNEKDISISS